LFFENSVVRNVRNPPSWRKDFSLLRGDLRFPPVCSLETATLGKSNAGMKEGKSRTRYPRDRVRPASLPGTGTPNRRVGSGKNSGFEDWSRLTHHALACAAGWFGRRRRRARGRTPPVAGNARWASQQNNLPESGSVWHGHLLAVDDCLQASATLLGPWGDYFCPIALADGQFAR